MSKNLKFTWPKITRPIKRAVMKQLNSAVSIYNQSGIFLEFENKFAALHGRSYSLLCNSGTTAIHSMFVACDLKEGDEVICPAYTFFATVTPLLFLGAKPVLADCDANGNIDPQEVARLITKKTKAVLVTHMWGLPAQMDKLVAICKKHRLLLLEDCSHAHGAKYKGRFVGSFGDLAAWSLQGAKVVTGGEGGILLTNSRRFYERALLLGHYNKRALQGISKESELYPFAVTGFGLKYRAHPLAVAMASEVLNDLPKAASYRQLSAKDALSKLAKETKLTLPPGYFDKKIIPSWYAFTFLLPSESLAKALEEKAKEKGLSDIDHPGSTQPLNLLTLFRNPGKLFPVYRKPGNRFSYRPGDFPRAEDFAKRLIKFPLGVDRSDLKLVKAYLKGLVKILQTLEEEKLVGGGKIKKK